MKLDKEIQFILAVDALKNVQRRNYNADDSRRENTAEHSWQIVILAQILYPYAKNKDQVDLLRVIRMLSIHDLVEINAGDTFLFDEEQMKGKFEREKIAAKKIFGILDEPLQSEFYNMWIEFEEEETPDAIFACSIDRIMPFILNSNTSGKSWTEAGITETQVRNMLENAIKRASDEMGEAFDILLQKSIDEGKLVS
ncbi:HD family hydrolase [Elizabethkingia anophelis]|uniref:HD domain-containing protein n=1 Tax=Elizabethkingia anophelis TaxID=1117645 RepID=UPI00038A2CFC|nr:HD domain-containing protein [Elizabethkingia anophelis]EQB91695.1 metal-dependent phosphohydrolase [Elizabethkingia anophelis 502]MCT3925124.1 HD domain-containing protein [Elizabethkingia anophelis]MCT4063976.1 HD domain-containing protein [Elizabethkingia anophelis]MCT4110261.1 HD domain-containing protein [Elizabethkingia anophelis]MDV3799115.1 HD domain-containing protein [Elizabethkingia anophelis]